MPETEQKVFWASASKGGSPRAPYRVVAIGDLSPNECKVRKLDDRSENPFIFPLRYDWMHETFTEAKEAALRHLDDAYHALDLAGATIHAAEEPHNG